LDAGIGDSARWPSRLGKQWLKILIRSKTQFRKLLSSGADAKIIPRRQSSLKIVLPKCTPRLNVGYGLAPGCPPYVMKQ
jgi:hypothetical protein